ncbi:MmgE/PrpD family protein [Pedobacter lusitanus]|uniref:MmgE/PrpD family protein n=1 Tax=Pedobacter lusitanus TaxID=1503925 RepID=UPI0009E1BAB3|nr:MmgE/PrpD family protein [Pedobacter lusitanus]
MKLSMNYDKQLQTRQIASFVLNTTYKDIGKANIEQLKRHFLDAIGSLVHASVKPTIKKLIRQIQAMDEQGNCYVPLTKNLAYDRAAQLYTALIRYPDFMDNFMAKEATCHPSDNIGALLAAAQYKKCSGQEFLTVMAIAYQIECRLVKEIPVMKEGIDHTLMLAYSATAASAKLIGLDKGADRSCTWNHWKLC